MNMELTLRRDSAICAGVYCQHQAISINGKPTFALTGCLMEGELALGIHDEVGEAEGR
jgi:hypothetical protein